MCDVILDIAYVCMSGKSPRERCITIVGGHARHSNVGAYVRVYVCVYIKLHITAQSGLVILVILCHSH